MKKLAVLGFLFLLLASKANANVMLVSGPGVFQAYFGGDFGVQQFVMIAGDSQYLGNSYKFDGHTLHFNDCFNITEEPGVNSYNQAFIIPMPPSGKYTLVYNAIGYSIPDIANHPEINCSSGSDILGPAIETHSRTMEFDVINLDMNMFPNPTTGPISFYGWLPEGRTLHVMDAMGRSVLSQQVTNIRMDLDLSSLPAGQYTAYVLTADGKKLHLRKKILVIH